MKEPFEEQMGDLTKFVGCGVNFPFLSWLLRLQEGISKFLLDNLCLGRKGDSEGSLSLPVLLCNNSK